MTFMVIQCEDGRASINQCADNSANKNSTVVGGVTSQPQCIFLYKLSDPCCDCVAACTATAKSFTPATVHQKNNPL